MTRTTGQRLGRWIVTVVLVIGVIWLGLAAVNAPVGPTVDRPSPKTTSGLHVEGSSTPLPVG